MKEFLRNDDYKRRVKYEAPADAELNAKILVRFERKALGRMNCPLSYLHAHTHSLFFASSGTDLKRKETRAQAAGTSSRQRQRQ